MFLQMEFRWPRNEKHKVALATKGPFRVVSTMDTAVVVRIGEKQKRVSRNRVVKAPPAVVLIKEVL